MNSDENIEFDDNNKRDTASTRNMANIQVNKLNKHETEKIIKEDLENEEEKEMDNDLEGADF